MKEIFKIRYFPIHILYLIFLGWGCIPPLDETPVKLAKLDNILRLVESDKKVKGSLPSTPNPVEASKPKLNSPVFSHGSGTYSEGQFVTVYKPADSPMDSVVYLSIDGSDPVCGDGGFFNFSYYESTTYFSTNSSLKAVHCHEEFIPSDIAAIDLEFDY